MKKAATSTVTRRARWRWVVVGIAAGGLGLLLATTRCTNFRHTWKQAEKKTVPQEDLLEGRWSGTWSSETRDDGGLLQCVIRKLPDGTYEAHFLATYFKIFKFNSTVVLRVVRRGDEWRFRGRADLGFLAGGEYTYDGRADGKQFFSKYTSRYDHGVFQMERVVQEPKDAAAGARVTPRAFPAAGSWPAGLSPSSL